MHDTFLLNSTPTTEHQVTIIGEEAMLFQQTQFELDIQTVTMLTWFLQTAKADEKERHTYTEEHWTLDYNPEHGPGDLEAFRLTRRATGRTISMARSTAFKLLDALTGKTEHLVKA
jgi:hypothetical protein